MHRIGFVASNAFFLSKTEHNSDSNTFPTGKSIRLAYAPPNCMYTRTHGNDDCILRAVCVCVHLKPLNFNGERKKHQQIVWRVILCSPNTFRAYA